MMQSVISSISGAIDSGKTISLLLADSEDAELWPVVVRLFEDRDITLTGTQELTPKEARNIAYPSLGPSKTVDKARENSVPLKYQLSRLFSDILRGDDARAKVDQLDKGMRATVEKWRSRIWK